MITHLITHWPRAAYRVFWFSLLALGVMSVLSCSQQTREQQTPAPSSSLTEAQALTFAKVYWVGLNTDRDVFQVAPTGSMVPVLDSHSVILVERFTGQVNVDDICIYDHDPKLPAVIHRAVKVDLKGRAVIFEGDGNPIGPQGQSSSDGWISMDRINWRVAGIIYTQRSP